MQVLYQAYRWPGWTAVSDAKREMSHWRHLRRTTSDYLVETVREAEGAGEVAQPSAP
jgi:hypothetical protein